jgi:hypothetical protein
LEATKRERYYYELLDSTLNTKFPQRSKVEGDKEYREKNREKIAIKSKEYQNKEEIAIKIKEYREKNKEKIALQKKEYGKINREEIQEKNKKRILCDCGENINKNNKSRHLKSKKHNDLILCKDIVL